MFGIIGWVLFGLVAGIVAKLIMPGRDPGGFIVTILLGIVGAVIAGFIGQALGLYGEGEPAGFIMSVIGAVLLLVIYRMFMRPRSQTVA
ncbi:MAG: GlsB/YeaQ/YmgE family stress response membrane protein [Vicinamibacterales bacterium]